jgi:hypothetical protein
MPNSVLLACHLTDLCDKCPKILTVLARPKLLNLLKAFMVSSAFLLWGIDQLLSPG